jgi:hypothetical protein
VDDVRVPGSGHPASENLVDRIASMRGISMSAAPRNSRASPAASRRSEGRVIRSACLPTRNAPPARRSSPLS